MNTWDGTAKGSALGNLIFIKIITLFGPLPAYALLIFVTLYYTFFDQKGIQGLKKFRQQVGLKSSRWWHLYRHYFSFGMALIDKVAWTITKKPRLRYSFINDHFIEAALEENKGVIFLSAHIGNWEIAGNSLHSRFQRKSHVVLVDNEQPEIKQVFRNITKKRTFDTIVMNHDILTTIIPIRNALAKNEFVCFHGDRVMGARGKQCKFLGKSAEFPDGPFQIAAIIGAPIVPVFFMKKGMNQFSLKVFEPIYLGRNKNGNRQQRVSVAMETYISYLEEVVRKHPYQWYNFYDFWTNHEV